jgi:hypothetical protein
MEKEFKNQKKQPTDYAQGVITQMYYTIYNLCLLHV